MRETDSERHRWSLSFKSDERLLRWGMHLNSAEGAPKGVGNRDLNSSHLKERCKGVGNRVLRSQLSSAQSWRYIITHRPAGQGKVG